NGFAARLAAVRPFVQLHGGGSTASFREAVGRSVQTPAATTSYRVAGDRAAGRGRGVQNRGVQMRMRNGTVRGVMLGAVALLTACGSGEAPESLRDALARLPRDTTPTAAESAAAAASLPLDTTLLRPGSGLSVEDTSPLPVAVVVPGGPIVQDPDGAVDEESDEGPADTGRSP